MTDLDLIDEMESAQAWSKARRGVVVQRVLCAIEDCSLDLIPFDEARERLHLNRKICRGLQEIELDEIRGSVGRYMEIESQIHSIQRSLENDRSEPLAYDEAAALWYREIYSPTVQEIRENGVIDRFPGRTAADIFIWMWRREPELHDYDYATSYSDLERASFDPLRRIFRKLSAAARQISS